MAAMQGTFMVSLDCEGKWGMADHLDGWHHAHLRREELVPAYERLVGLFGRYEVPASFAFVMALLLSPNEQRAMAARFVDTKVEGRNWLKSYRDAQADNDLEGWSCPELLDIVRSGTGHEIACHGFTHLPLGEDLVGAEAVAREMTACGEVAKAKGLKLETLVYPRNLVGHQPIVAEAGFTGYRARPPRRGKASALLAEMNPLDRAQVPLADEAGMVVIPSGEMLNWQSGPRRYVPRAASKRRWKARLGHAARSGGVAHLWLHPHNIIDAPGTFERLEDILSEAARLRDAGRLVTATQAQYCAAQMQGREKDASEPT